MQKFPLSWPEGWKRTKPFDRLEAKFHTISWRRNNLSQNTYKEKAELSIAQGIQRLVNELRTLGVGEGDYIISTNLVLKLDGFPRSDQKEPQDPGVAVYWKDKSDAPAKVMAIDLYDRVADNIAALAATLFAMRAIERHGGATILERAFLGFTCLPEPKNWRDIFGVNGLITLPELKIKFKELAKKRHPDMGGSHEAMAELNRAMYLAEKELNV